MIATLNLIEGESDVQWVMKNLPDGHKHIDLSNNQAIFENITALDIIIRITNYNDIFILKQVVSAVRYVNPSVQLNLCITYLLGARWDRRMYIGDSQDLKIVCDDINSLKFDAVMVVEPHSIVTSSLLDNFSAISPMESELADYIRGLDNQSEIVIFAPDLGAVKRTEQFIHESQLPLPVGYLHKERNLLTGAITGMKIISSPDIKGKTIILYDDLCDGGKTFTSASQVLREAGASKVILAVTHGVFSKGVDNLLNDEQGRIDHIITTDSYQKQLEHPKVTIVPFL